MVDVELSPTEQSEDVTVRGGVCPCFPETGKFLLPWGRGIGAGGGNQGVIV